jgi:hypothetical protein
MIRRGNSDQRAHLSYTLRNFMIICCRSASVFSGIHAGIESDVAGGSRKGKRRMNAPNILNEGTMNKTDGNIAEVPLPYVEESTLPEYTPYAEPVTRAMYLFKFAFCKFYSIFLL